MLTDIIRLVLGNQQNMCFWSKTVACGALQLILRGDNSPGDLDPKFMQMIESGGADIAACTGYNMVLNQDGSSRSW